MSVLKRVEELYLEVLRFIIIAAASLLLLAAVVFGALAASNYSQSSHGNEPAPASVNPADVTEGVLAAKSDKKPAASNAPSQVGEEGNASDPNEATYERVAKVVVEFVGKHGRGIEVLQKGPVIEVTKRKTHQYEDPAVAKEFVEGLAVAMEKTLADPKVLKLFEPLPAPKPAVAENEEVEQAAPVVPLLRESPIEMVNSALSTYIRLFNEKLKERERAKDEAAAAEIAKKAAAMTQLTIAGATFGAFLFLVFISIVVKIERNLRALSATAQEQPGHAPASAALHGHGPEASGGPASGIEP